MSIADKLTTIAENEQKVYDAGKEAENRQFWERLWNNARTITDNEYFFQGSFAGSTFDTEFFEKAIYPTEPVYIKTSGGEYAFYYCNRGGISNTTKPIDLTEFCERVNFSKCTKMSYCFHNARATNITLDLSNCETLLYAFSAGNGGSLSNINIKVTNKCTTFSSAFAYTNTESIIFMEGSEIVNSISFAQASLLSNESVQSIIDALSINATAKKITFHSNVVTRLTAEQSDQIINKGWTIG